MKTQLTFANESKQDLLNLLNQQSDSINQNVKSWKELPDRSNSHYFTVEIEFYYTHGVWAVAYEWGIIQSAKVLIS